MSLRDFIVHRNLAIYDYMENEYYVKDTELKKYVKALDTIKLPKYYSKLSLRQKILVMLSIYEEFNCNGRFHFNSFESIADRNEFIVACNDLRIVVLEYSKNDNPYIKLEVSSGEVIEYLKQHLAAFMIIDTELESNI